MKTGYMAAMALSLLVAAAPARAADGLIEKTSPHGVKQTLDRFESVLKAKGITIFARIDHAAGARKIGQELPPTELIIFGSPKMGAPLMTANQSIGIDLPLKLLAWRDDAGQVWIAYNDPAALKARHQIKGRDKLFGKMSKVLGALTDAALK